MDQYISWTAQRRIEEQQRLERNRFWRLAKPWRQLQLALYLVALILFAFGGWLSACDPNQDLKVMLGLSGLMGVAGGAIGLWNAHKRKRGSTERNSANSFTQPP